MVQSEKFKPKICETFLFEIPTRVVVLRSYSARSYPGYFPIFRVRSQFFIIAQGLRFCYNLIFVLTFVALRIAIAGISGVLLAMWW